MQYLGGKSRIAKQIAAVIDRERRPGQPVWDAFCGGLSTAVALSVKGPVWCSDANAALINLYRAVKAGWDPPTEVSKETYRAAKFLPDTDPLKAFCGFGCAFAGKWFGGFAASGARNYAAQARAALLRDVPRVAAFAHADALRQSIDVDVAAVYADPPYAGTTGYAAVEALDRAAFEAAVCTWAQRVQVFVSEYSFPHGVCVWEGEQTTTVNAGQSKSGFRAVERLYRVRL